MEAGRYDEALDLFREALRIREGLDYRMGAVINLHNIGDVHMRRGDDARAWAAFKKSHEIAIASGFEHGEVMNEAYLAFLEGRQGQGDSEKRLIDVLKRADSIGQHETRVNARWFLGKHRFGQGDMEGARNMWEEGLAVAADLDSPQLARELEVALQSLA
jgi:tetratricopeptide (TPR) repeat protein